MEGAASPPSGAGGEARPRTSLGTGVVPQPFARIDWEARLGADKPQQVSPAIAQQQGETRALSDSAAAQLMEAKLLAKREAAAAEQGAQGAQGAKE